MKKYDFKNAVSMSSLQLKDFLGVDFTTNESEVEYKRSPDALNMIAGKQGSVDKRRGFKIEHDFGSGNVHLVRKVNFYASKDGVIGEYYAIIAQVGTNFWYYSDYTDEWRVVKAYGASESDPALEFHDVDSHLENILNDLNYFLVFDNWVNNTNDLWILRFITDFNDVVLVGLNLNVAGSTTAMSAYIPTTSIARKPSGVGTPYEGVNLLCYDRINTFLSDSSTNYYIEIESGSSLDATHYSVTQMQSDGTFSTFLHNAGGSAITVSIDTVNKRFVFSGAPHATYQTGVDNIKIQYAVLHSGATWSPLDAEPLHQFDSYARFGLNGNRNYLFMTNASDDTNSTNRNQPIERWVKMPEEVGGTIYLSEYSYANLGSNQKMGYSNFGEYLIVHGKRYLDEPTLYLRTASLDSDGEITFPSKPSQSNAPAIAYNGFASLRDDPLFVTESGVSAVVLDSNYGVQTVQDRGFYINERLINEEHIEEAKAVIYKDRYFLFVTNSTKTHVYIADPRMKYTEKRSYSESFQYDWFYWELDFLVSSVYAYEEDLVVGTSDGKVMSIKPFTHQYAYCDESNKVATEWTSGTLYTEGDIAYDIIDTNYYVCIKEHGSGNALILTNTKYWKPIIQDTSVYQIPITAYWMTPVLNMKDITTLKTLKNLWTRIVRYSKTSINIYYKTDGSSELVKTQTADIFGFDNIDFERFTFNTDDDPAVIVTNRMQRKFMSIQFKFENIASEAFSLLEVVAKYTVNSRYKG